MAHTGLSIIDLEFQWEGSKDLLIQCVTMHLQKGTVNALVGINGCGKSTLFELISRRLIPKSGKVLIDNNNAKIEDFNYLPQSYNRLIFNHLTNYENILLLRNNTSGKYINFIDQLFPDKSTLSCYPSQISGGQMQRLAICRAIMDIPNFPVTLLDESLSHLSQEVKAAINQAISRTVKETSSIVFFVTHDIIEAIINADQVLTLANGKLQVFDTSEIHTIDDCFNNNSLFGTISKILTLEK
jgi:ABC-type nitrate/sulfonate/bicarbonate transport system ATPase subunit